MEREREGEKEICGKGTCFVVVHNHQILGTLKNHVFKFSMATHDVGKEANNLTLICAFTVASTIMWDYEMWYTFRTKII